MSRIKMRAGRQYMSSFVCLFLGRDLFSAPRRGKRRRRARSSNESLVLGVDASIKKKKYFIDDSGDTWKGNIKIRKVHTINTTEYILDPEFQSSCHFFLFFRDAQ